MRCVSTFYILDMLTHSRTFSDVLRCCWRMRKYMSVGMIRCCHGDYCVLDMQATNQMKYPCSLWSSDVAWYVIVTVQRMTEPSVRDTSLFVLDLICYLWHMINNWLVDATAAYFYARSKSAESSYDINFVMSLRLSVCLSVREEQLNSCWTHSYKILYWKALPISVENV